MKVTSTIDMCRKLAVIKNENHPWKSMSDENPIIASFFNNIGYADELGSGTRNLFWKNPRIIDDNYTAQRMALLLQSHYRFIM